MFNQEEYWKRRKHVKVTRNELGEITAAEPAPLSGQVNQQPKPKLFKLSPTKLVVDLNNNLKALNRAQRRVNPKNRTYTKKGYRNGVRLKNVFMARRAKNA